MASATPAKKYRFSRQDFQSLATKPLHSTWSSTSRRASFPDGAREELVQEAARGEIEYHPDGCLPSAHYQNAGGANHGAPLPFSHPHYAMDAERTIHPKVMGKGLNNSGLAVHQDEIINTVVMYVQDSLRNELSYRDIILLVNSTPEAPVKATTSSCHATSSRRSYSYS
ncbi:hypothetical protein PF006_g11205 [Phytophthora fragariae]|uniref:Uncharacterized protein n=1 Tax=Phytophthora fragariae TaxID=53985 RepID=A0A6A3U2G2_9STRA|nr:hypothetical protein PF006_g11205 [Phytophthora fragariae]